MTGAVLRFGYRRKKGRPEYGPPLDHSRLTRAIQLYERESGGAFRLLPAGGVRATLGPVDNVRLTGHAFFFASVATSKSGGSEGRKPHGSGDEIRFCRPLPP